VAIRQKKTTRNRAPGTTSTECYDFLRCCSMRGRAHVCPHAANGWSGTRWTVAARLLRFPRRRDGTRCSREREAHPTPSAARSPVRAARRVSPLFKLVGLSSFPPESLRSGVLGTGFRAGGRLAITAVTGTEIRQRLVDTVRPATGIGEASSRARPAASGSASARPFAANAARWSSPCRSRACSASTCPSAPARDARGSATPSILTWTCGAGQDDHPAGAVDPGPSQYAVAGIFR